MDDKSTFDGEKDASFEAVRAAKLSSICIHEICIIHDCSNEEIDS